MAKTNTIQPKGKFGRDKKPISFDKIKELWLEGYTYPEITALLRVSRQHIWRNRKIKGGVGNATLLEKITHLTNREKLKYDNKIPLKFY